MASSPQPKAQEWVRLLGHMKKSQKYKGNLALVVHISNSSLLDLWLIYCGSNTMTKLLLLVLSLPPNSLMLKVPGCPSEISVSKRRGDEMNPLFSKRMNSPLRDTLSSHDKSCSFAKRARHFQPSKNWPGSWNARQCSLTLWSGLADGLN